MFFTRLAISLAVAIAALAAFFVRQSPQAPEIREHVRGRNNTILFIVAEHDGHHNVHMATAQALLEKHPGVEIHFVSFQHALKKLPRIAELARKRQPLAQDIISHELVKGPPWKDAVGGSAKLSIDEDGHSSVIIPPAATGIRRLAKLLQYCISPWQAEAHLALHDEIASFIDQIDPAIVVLDTIFPPAIEATRLKKRLHAFITPNPLIFNFITHQPASKMLWKYPAFGSGFPYPVPWYLIPMNIYLNTLFISSIAYMPEFIKKKAFLLDNGVLDPINFYGQHRPDTPWLTMETKGAAVPMDVIPLNITCTGPMVLLSASAEEQDPELMKWIKQKPTVLINMGAAFRYSIQHTEAFIGAIEDVLDKSDLQILWKYDTFLPTIKLDWKAAVKPLEDTGRVKVFKWLNVDPAALMNPDYIAASLTHGGSNGYHEAIYGGVPQIVLPMWADLYDFAQLVEQTGIGLWACRETSPRPEAHSLSNAILRVADGGPESLSMRAKVKVLSDKAKANPGREIAAKVIAGLASYE